MDKLKEVELLKELTEAKKELTELRKDSIRLKLVLSDYGIDEQEMEDISDSEIICIEQLKKIRETCDDGVPFSKDDADIFKILNKQLMDIRGGTITRKRKVAEGKDVSDEELQKQLTLIKTK